MAKNLKTKSIFSKRLRKLRQDHDISQQRIATIIGTSQQVYGRWELGIYQPDIDTIVALAIYFGVSTDYLLGLTNNMYTDYNRKKDADEMAMSLDNSIHVNRNKVRGNIHIKK